MTRTYLFNATHRGHCTFRLWPESANTSFFIYCQVCHRRKIGFIKKAPFLLLRNCLPLIVVNLFEATHGQCTFAGVVTYNHIALVNCFCTDTIVNSFSVYASKVDFIVDGICIEVNKGLQLKATHRGLCTFLRQQ